MHHSGNPIWSESTDDHPALASLYDKEDGLFVEYDAEFTAEYDWEQLCYFLDDITITEFRINGIPMTKNEVRQKYGDDVWLALDKVCEDDLSENCDFE